MTFFKSVEAKFNVCELGGVGDSEVGKRRQVFVKKDRVMILGSVFGGRNKTKFRDFTILNSDLNLPVVETVEC